MRKKYKYNKQKNSYFFSDLDICHTEINRQKHKTEHTGEYIWQAIKHSSH